LRCAPASNLRSSVLRCYRRKPQKFFSFSEIDDNELF
jgi:hypothetical protein